MFALSLFCYKIFAVLLSFLSGSALFQLSLVATVRKTSSLVLRPHLLSSPLNILEII